jgi:hypothetical protein
MAWACSAPCCSSGASRPSRPFKGFYIPWQIPLISLAAVTIILAFTGWIALRRVLKTEPAAVFR